MRAIYVQIEHSLSVYAGASVCRSCLWYDPLHRFVSSLFYSLTSRFFFSKRLKIYYKKLSFIYNFFTDFYLVTPNTVVL